LNQQNNALSRLNNFAIELSNLSFDDNLEKFIARQLKYIAGDEAAVFSEYNPANRTTTIKYME